MFRSLRALALGVLLVAAAGIAFAGPPIDFIPLEGAPGCGFFGCVQTLSGDGTKILGTGWTWTEQDGFVVLPAGGTASAMSNDGNTIVGAVRNSANKNVAGVLVNGSWQMVAPDPGGFPGETGCGSTVSTAMHVSDNDLVVGNAWVGGCSGTHGFVGSLGWPGLIDLGSFVPDRSSRINRVSTDGAVMVGYQDNDFGSRLGQICDGDGCRWFEDIAITGNYVGEPYGISSDGSVVVGGNYTSVDGLPQEAWIWTEETGVQGIGLVKRIIGAAADGQTFAFDVSDDGGVVVGRETLFLAGELYGFVWTPDSGMQYAGDYFRANGTGETKELLCDLDGANPNAIVRSDCWAIVNVSGVSDDGSVIAGTMLNWGTFQSKPFIAIGR